MQASDLEKRVQNRLQGVTAEMIRGDENNEYAPNTITPYHDVAGDCIYQPDMPVRYNDLWDGLYHIRLGMAEDTIAPRTLTQTLGSICGPLPVTEFHPSFYHSGESEHIEIPFAWYDANDETDTLLKVSLYPSFVLAETWLDRAVSPDQMRPTRSRTL